MIQAPPLPAWLVELWHAVFDLGELVGDGWTIIGGQVVALHCWERGVIRARPTTDVDAGLDIRGHPDVARALTAALKELGFKAEHRAHAPTVSWHRDMHQIDVLIPTGTGRARKDVDGGSMLASHGIEQAVRRSERVELVVGGRSGWISRPNLFGAVVGKAAAFSNVTDTSPARHVEDLGLLLEMLHAEDVDQVTDRDLTHIRRANKHVFDLLSPYYESEDARAAVQAIERLHAARIAGQAQAAHANGTKSRVTRTDPHPEAQGEADRPAP